MEYVRIAVLSVGETVCAFFDNQIPDAMHYSEACLHTYLQGSAYTLEIETDTSHEDVQYLVEGNKIAFVYKGKEYMCNIVSVERTETDITVTCWGLLLELTNETRDAFKSNGAMTLQQYINYADPEHVLTLGINEVSEKRIANEWEGSQTILARLYSIATLFSAEMEFVTELNSDYSLKQVILNVYKAHDDDYQGIGENRTDQVLRYGNTISTIRKASDISELYTAIHPTGKDGLDLSSISGREVKDKDGNVEFFVAYGIIYAKQARDRFPSAIGKEGYIGRDWTYETENVEVLYGQALALLKKYSVPEMTYEIEGYYDANIGDTFTIQDEAYKPMLILEARVTEQEEHFVDTSQNKTTFSNVVELASEVSPSLLAAMKKLIAQNKVYACNITTDNGIIFRNGTGTTTLTAQVKDGAVDKTDDYAIQWYKDGNALTAAKSVAVNASDVVEKSVYKFLAYDADGKEIGQYEVTVTNVTDGKNGKDGKDGQNGRDGTPGTDGAPGKPGTDGKTSYTHIAYANSEDGKTDFSVSNSDRAYVGMYVDFTQADSADPTKYHWSLIKGADGSQGTPGKPGEDGKTPYFHVAYANSADGKTGFSTTDSNNKTYIGQYTDFTQADSTDPSKYMWTKIQGPTGPTGAKGDKGATGPQGPQGTQGPQGPKGTDGKNGANGSNGQNALLGDLSLSPIILPANASGAVTSYSGANGTFKVINGTTEVSGGVTYSLVSSSGVTTSINSTTGAYTVSSMPNGTDYGTAMLQAVYKGAKIQKILAVIKAKQGASGKGISTTTVTYQASSSGTTAPTGTWSSSIPSVSANQYLWTRTITTYTDSTTSTAYSVGKMGANGATGATGATGAAGKDGVGISGTVVTYQASGSGTVTPTGTWLSTIPSVSAGQYLWTRTVTTYTNKSTSTAYSVGKMGTNGVDGDSGIIIQATAPSNPYVGQLWQTTSGAPIKRWDGSKWVIWYLDVSNLNVQNLAAIAATIGTVSNPYTTGVESEWSNEALNGKITIGGAGIKNEYTQTGNNWKGMWRLAPGSYDNFLRDANGELRSGTMVGYDGVSIYDYSSKTWMMDYSTHLTPTKYGCLKLATGFLAVWGSRPVESMSRDVPIGGYSATIDLSSYGFVGNSVSFATPKYPAGFPRVMTIWDDAKKTLKVACDANAGGIFVNWIVIGKWNQ